MLTVFILLGCIRVWLIKEQILVFCFPYLCYIISHRIYEALDAI